MSPNPVRRSLLAYAGLSLLAGCAFGVQPEPYYGENWDPPSVDSVSVTSEIGTQGGGTVTISGAGFGEDPDRLVVEFGQHSATIVAVTDAVITVVVPPGPLTGGAVDIDVATPTGFSALNAGYTYDTQGVYDNQSAYVQVNNFWESCLGGLSTRSDDEHGNLGCSSIAYIGYTGITGRAEGYSFLYPRIHTPNSGFFSATDAGAPEWHIERPGQIGYAFGVDNLHQDIGPVTLHNEYWSGSKSYCADLDSIASYRYGGGDEGFPGPYVVSPATLVAGEKSDACAEGETEYDLGTLDFCTSDDVDGIPTDVYDADWPVNANFFQADKNELEPVDITLDAPEAGLDGVPLTLPEPIVVYTTQGMTPPADATDPETDLWSIGNFDSCFADTDGDAERLADTAIEFTWTPSSGEASSGDQVVAARTYVRVSITAMALNWFGVTTYPVRAVIEVPDQNDYDRQSGLSHLTVPAYVLYQIPTVALPQGSSFGDGYLDSTVGNWGYVVVDFQRVTDYTLSSTLKGDVVFSYTTGDFGFFGWTNPTESDGCHNCLDDDGDGWPDAADPDCSGDATAELGPGDTACNDGLDNDGDGRSDSGDTACDDADDPDESNCSDGEDNDTDGYADDDDPDCIAGGNEENDDAITPCTNAVDDDGDGWVGSSDPDCAVGNDELGMGDTECNDGTDNDGDLFVDADDPDCTDALAPEAT